VADSPALKEMFNAARYRRVADVLGQLEPRFDRDEFLKLTLTGLAERSLLQRMRRMSEALHASIPGSYPQVLDVLRKLAPKLQHNFVSIVLPDYVSVYGCEHFELSLDALRHLTRFGSSEFGIRTFLKKDLARTLREMAQWADDPDEHVRRLASEGSRPRLPWSFRLDEIVRNPELTAPILAKLINDPSLYVRKSVANHLNDHSKDHPEWLVDWIGRQDLSQPHTRWIAKRALRTLIKRGDPAALKLLGATGKAELKGIRFSVTPNRLALGSRVTINFSATASGKRRQNLVIDFAVHYVKSSGATSAKIFKWKVVEADPGMELSLSKGLRLQDFTTRKHYPGLHRVVVHANGSPVAEESFVLTTK
jgi:3-methyladenine DNA glycosylase AlkC